MEPGSYIVPFYFSEFHLGLGPTMCHLGSYNVPFKFVVKFIHMLILLKYFDDDASTWAQCRTLLWVL